VFQRAGAAVFYRCDRWGAALRLDEACAQEFLPARGVTRQAKPHPQRPKRRQRHPIAAMKNPQQLGCCAPKI
jgi:hypothetical protein